MKKFNVSFNMNVSAWQNITVHGVEAYNMRDAIEKVKLLGNKVFDEYPLENNGNCYDVAEWEWLEGESPQMDTGDLIKKVGEILAWWDVLSNMKQSTIISTLMDEIPEKMQELKQALEKAEKPVEFEINDADTYEIK